MKYKEVYDELIDVELSEEEKKIVKEFVESAEDEFDLVNKKIPKEYPKNVRKAIAIIQITEYDFIYMRI